MNAQNNSYLDSLKEELIICEDDSIKLTLLYDISMAYRNTSPNEAIKYANQVRELSEQLNNRQYLINAYILLGNIARNTSKLDEAADYYYEALNISEESKDSIRMSACYNNIGNIYQSQGNYTKSINFYKQSLDIEKKMNMKAQISIRYYNIGTIYQLIDSLELAKSYYNSSLEIEKELNSPEGLYYAYYGLASVETEQENYSKGLEYFNYALKNAKEANTIIGIASITNELGKLYQLKKEYPKAIEYYLESIELANSVNYSDVTIDSYKNLSEIYKKIKLYDYALRYLEKYIALNDSVNNLTMKNTIAELETKYESNKKEQRIKQQEDQLKIEKAENEKNIAQRNLLLLGFGLLIILLVFIFHNYRLKKKANNLLAEKNEEISTQHKNLQFINNQITNSINYAKKIQQAILPGYESFNHIFKSYFIYYKPKDIVSGDFYWLTKIENKIILAIADCTGHGVPGAFMSMIGNTLLNEIVNQRKITDPSTILKELNSGVVDALNQKNESTESQDDGMDITVCSIDEDFSGLNISLANHQACMLSRGSMDIIEGDVYSIGGVFAKRDNASFMNIHRKLSPGDIIYLYSDGFKDQISKKENKKYTSTRFLNFLTEISSKEMSLQHDLLDQEFNKWRGDHKQIDDILIIGIQI